MSCTIPQNKPIYQALLNKAANSTDNVYKAKAYNKAAEIIRTCNTDIYDLVKKCNSKWDFDDDFEDEELDIGSSVASFIYEYATENPLPQPTGSFLSTPPQSETAIVEPACTIPQNCLIYEALIKKANSYTDQDSYQAKAYYTAAESVLSFEDDIVAGVSEYEDYWSMKNYVPGVGTKIANYITSIVIGIKDKATTSTETAATVIPRTNLETLRYNAKEAAINAREAALNAREMALNVRELQIKAKETESAAADAAFAAFVTAAAVAAANTTEKSLTNV